MICPSCGESLSTVTLGTQQVSHCSNCGGSFFAANQINRITLDDAKKLASDHHNAPEKSDNLSCPRDSIFLELMKEESIPSYIRLYRCSICKGIFASQHDLVRFKEAQGAKINYFKIWQMPLPSLQAVVVFSFFALISFTLITATSVLQRKTISTSQATDIMHGFNAAVSNRYLFISFNSDVPVRSSITITDTFSGKITNRPISLSLAKHHQLVSGDIDLSHPDSLLYSIELIDEKGTTVKTPLQKLILK